MLWTGFGSHPQGHIPTLGLIFFSIFALCTSFYAFYSCYFVTVTYESYLGSFGDIDGSTAVLINNGGGDSSTIQLYRMKAGLFSWLKPNYDDIDAQLQQPIEWNKGTCTGYTEQQLKIMSDPKFEVSRYMGVTVVLLGVVLVIWSLMLPCMELVNKIQINTLRLMYGLCFVCTSLTFIFHASKICNNNLIGSNGLSSCKIDESGLITIASSLLWFLAFVISIRFVRLPTSHNKSLYGGYGYGQKQQQKPQKTKKTNSRSNTGNDNEDKPQILPAGDNSNLSVVVTPNTPTSVTKSKGKRPTSSTTKNNTSNDYSNVLRDLFFLESNVKRENYDSNNTSEDSSSDDDDISDVTGDIEQQSKSKKKNNNKRRQ